MKRKYNITFDTFIKKTKDEYSNNLLQKNIFNKNKKEIKFDDFILNKRIKKESINKNNKTEFSNN